MEIVGAIVLIMIVLVALAQFNYREPIVPGYFELYMLDEDYRGED